MAFDKLTEALSATFKKITKQDRISDKHLDTLLSDVRLALLMRTLTRKSSMSS